MTNREASGPPSDQHKDVSHTGIVDTQSGRAFVERRGGKRTPLSPGARLFNGDRVETVEGGWLAIMLADGARITLAPASRLKLDAVYFDAKSHIGIVDIAATEGAFHVAGGQIGRRLGGAEAVLRTPYAAIHLPAPGGAVAGRLSGEHGLALFMLIWNASPADGGVRVENAAGWRRLEHARATSVVSSASNPPSEPAVIPQRDLLDLFGGFEEYGCNLRGRQEIAPAAGRHAAAPNPGHAGKPMATTWSVGGSRTGKRA